jgi:fucose 4-O-acetylase-like acetyltransferase
MIPKPPPRSEWVDYSKGLAIFIILFHHTACSVRDHGILPQDSLFWSVRLWNDFEPLLRVGVFFFMVGLFVERSFSKVGMRSFVTTRVRTLLYPYVLWQMVSLIRSAYSHDWSFSDSLAVILQMPFHGFQQFWFLTTLLHTLIFYVLCRALGLSRQWIAGLCVAIYLLPYDPPFAVRAFATWQNNLPYFALGLMLADRKPELGRYRGPWMPAAGLAALALTLLSTEFHLSAHDISRAAVNITFIAGLVLIAVFLARFNILQLIRLLGSYSLEVYCLQTFAQATVIRLMQKIHVEKFWPMLIASMCATIVLPLAVGICDRRFGWRLFRWQKKPTPTVGVPMAKSQEVAAS